MFLKRIELEGFKSFADRTVVQVQRGLTGIVGPNGCGKSNVVDALLWVMGERSAKTLRADAMDDVIFKGAEGRAPAPYAMVEIILADDAGDIVEPGGEVAIGRRLFRGGEAEYLLNGRKVKRKEVRDVLMDTGLGVRSYMVLAQGKIDAVLSANAAERRSVFEEAAGISRYKARKHEAELKLNRVAQDLARVEDVYEEVQRAVRSLKYQAGKARRFVDTRDQYREGKIRLSWADSARHQVEETALRSRAEELEARITELRAERESAERKLQELDKEAGVLREHHDALRAAAAETKEKAAGLEERVRGLEGRAHELELRRERESERLVGLEQEDEGRRQEDGVLEQDRARLGGERERSAAALAQASTRFEQRREQHRELRGRLEELRQGVLEALGERTRHHNAAAAAAHDRSEAEGALKALERRTAEGESERQRLVGELDQARDALEQSSVRVGEGEDRARQLVTRRDSLREEREQSERAAAAARQDAAAARTRLQALSTVDEEQQGVPDRVRDLVKGGGEASLLLEGVSVPAPWDRLVEDLLGRMQHGLWLEGREAAAGLPEGAFDCFFPAASPAPVNVVAAAPLRGLLDGDPARCDALCSRLGEIYCVDDAVQARQLAAQHPGALFLSQDGELHGGGFARVGMLQGSGAEGILARRNARKEASALAERSERIEAESRARAERAGEELEQVSAELQALDGRLREAVAERDRAQARVQDLERRALALADEDLALADELRSAHEKRSAAEAAEAEASAARDAAEARREALNAELERAEGGAAEREGELESARQELQEARLADESVQQQLAHVEERIEAHQRLHDRDRQESGRIREELAELGRRAEELRQEAETGRGRTRELLSERGELDERLEQARVQFERARDAFEQARYGAQGGEGKLEQLLGERQEHALGLQRVQMQRAELVRTITEEFQQPLEDLVRGANLEEDQRPDGEQLEQLRAEVGRLRASLDSIGSVNLDAVAELEEREQRAEFLGKERGDLTEARTNLEATIEDLDRRCRDRFLETFDAVQGQFESIFRRLFRGGRADISLEAEVDPLVAGIEISVRPPGKELRSIKLLSGGERTLTALALLLAVFRSRPSPFCLLDEVDAALDDANVGRFLDVLDDFIGGTQFMVVTHNKLTMARCERLFGVTMRKAGVSLVVGVELSEIPESPEKLTDARTGLVAERAALAQAPVAPASAPARIAAAPEPAPVAEREHEAGA